MSEHLKITTEDTGMLERKRDDLVYRPKLSAATTCAEQTSKDFIELSESSTDVSENSLNIRRLKHFEEKYTNDFLRIIREQDFEYGFESMADKFIKQLMNQNKAVTREWLNRLFLRYFGDIKIISGLVQVLSHIEYAEIYPEGPTIALAALSHNNIEVRECGIRAFENWGTLESLHILEGLRFTEKWMQEYVNKVVSDLKEDFNLGASPR